MSSRIEQDVPCGAWSTARWGPFPVDTDEKAALVSRGGLVSRSSERGELRGCPRILALILEHESRHRPHRGNGCRQGRGPACYVARDADVGLHVCLSYFETNELHHASRTGSAKRQEESCAGREKLASWTSVCRWIWMREALHLGVREPALERGGVNVRRLLRRERKADCRQGALRRAIP